MSLRGLTSFRELGGEPPSSPSIFDAAGLQSDSEKLASYMEGCGCLAIAGSNEVDVFTLDEWTVPNAVMTDGVWIWTAALTHYVRTQAVAVDIDFVEHVRRSNYEPPDLSDADLIALSEDLLDRGAQSESDT